MVNNVINKPKISKWIGGMYIILTIFILILCITIAFVSDIRFSPLFLQMFFFGIMIFVLFLMTFTTVSFYKTQYVLQEDVLYSWSPFAIIKIKLKDIKKIERTMIPVHIRVGATLYSGRFYISRLGWTKSIITNLSDGIFITTKDRKHYLITPSNPDKFVKILNKKRIR